MIDEVAKALKAYEGLDALGKRLFRDELGLVRPQQARPRRRRAAAAPKLAVTEPTEAAAVRVRKPRATAVAPAGAPVLPTADSIPTVVQ